jgi:hypothetical protein
LSSSPVDKPESFAASETAALRREESSIRPCRRLGQTSAAGSGAERYRLPIAAAELDFRHNLPL